MNERAMPEAPRLVHQTCMLTILNGNNRGYDNSHQIHCHPQLRLTPWPARVIAHRRAGPFLRGRDGSGYSLPEIRCSHSRFADLTQSKVWEWYLPTHPKTDNEQQPKRNDECGPYPDFNSDSGQELQVHQGKSHRQKQITPGLTAQP